MLWSICVPAPTFCWKPPTPSLVSPPQLVKHSGLGAGLAHAEKTNMESCQLGQAPLFIAGAKRGELEKRGEGSGAAGVGIILTCCSRAPTAAERIPCRSAAIPRCKPSWDD